ncbi:MAG: ABC transporter substrate-binding protein [Spirochaetaceae bacterium]|nr:ABC transporter substrate-binding protein [Spirochaetaceae bacterium]
MKKIVLLFTLLFVVLSCNNNSNIVTFVVADAGPFVFNLQGDMALYEGLARFDTAGNIVPAIAKSWQINEDNTAVTFNLRPNITFSDGRPINMQAIIANFLQPITTDSYTTIIFNNILSFEILNDLTFRVNFKSPQFFIEDILPFLFILPMHVIQQHGDSWALPAKQVSSGPFILQSQRGNQMVMLANPHYWDRENVFIDRLIVLSIPDNPADTNYSLFNAFYTGRADWVATGPHIPRTISAQAFANRHTQIAPVLNTYFVAINHHGPLSDVRLRQALALAINRNNLSHILHGSRPIVQGIVPLAIPGYQHLGTWATANLFDPILARELLAEAGFAGGEGLTLTLMRLNAGGVPPIGDTLAESWRNELSIDVNIIDISPYQYLEEQINNGHLLIANYSFHIPDPLLFLSGYHSHFNIFGYSNLNFDNLLELAGFASTLEEYMALARLAEEILIVQDQALIPLFDIPTRAHLINLEKWDGWQANQRGSRTINTWVGIRPIN